MRNILEGRESRNPKESGVWVGPDFRTKKDIMISPGAATATIVTLPSPENVQPFINPGRRKLISTRSMLAQLNTHVIKGSEVILADAIREGRPEAEVFFHSHTQQEIAIKAGTGVGRLVRWTAENVTGEKLEELIHKEITIVGQQGSEWNVYCNPHTGTPEGLLLPLDPTYRRWLPPHREDIVISPEISGKKYRHQIDKWLKQIKDGDTPAVEISQTIAKLYLPPGGTHALIDDKIQPQYIPGFGFVNNSKHLNALVLFAGETGVVGTEEPWEIRSEIEEQEDPKQQPESIILTFPQPVSLSP